MGRFRPHPEVQAGNPGAKYRRFIRRDLSRSPSPIGPFGKAQLGTDFGKAKPAGVRRRGRGSEIPARRPNREVCDMAVTPMMDHCHEPFIPRVHQCMHSNQHPIGLRIKRIVPIIVALALSACAQKQGEIRSYGSDMLPTAQSYGNDALPSAEVTAFQKLDARLKYSNARIEHDANGCAVYRGTAADGKVHQEPLRDGSNQAICVSR